MQFGKFRLERYGPFEQLDLPLDPTPGRINLIVAPNGYGKSVIRRAITEFLFGIEVRTPMTFRFGTERMRLLADIVHDGATRSLVRRKGNGNTLAFADGTEVSIPEAQRLLGGANETIFQELFGLDTALLRSGGRDLIRSQGRLGQVLFAAGGGMGRVRDLLTELERQRDELGKANARHRSRPIWNALSNWEQGNADLRRTALRPDGWTALERQATEAARALEALLAEQTEESRERDRLRTIGACRPWLDRLRAAQHTLTEAADAPELDETFEKRWRDALENGVKSTSAAMAARTELQAAQEARARLAFDPAWIAAETDISALADLRGRALGAEADLPKVVRDLTADQARSATLRRDLGWDDIFPLPPASVVKDAQRRLQQHLKLAQEAATAADRLADADRQVTASLAELDALPGQNDITTVNDLATLLRAAGDPAARLDIGRREVRDAEAALRAALSAIPDHTLAESALGTTAAPSDARLDAAGKALGRAETAYDRAEQTHAARLTAVDTERTKLATLERAAMLPPPSALAAARAHRDALWAQLCLPIPAHPDPSAAVALDRAIRDADAVADALIAHGQDVAEAGAMRVRLDGLAADLATDADVVIRTATVLIDARGTLLTIARAAGGDTDDVSALRAFLRARQTAVVARDVRDAAVAERADIETSLASLGQRLAAAMDVAMPELTALGALLAEADRRIKADQELSAHRKTLTDQAGKQRTTRATAAAAVTKAEQVLAGWVEQWRPVGTALARPDGETMTMTADALVRIEELRAIEHQGGEAQRRIDDMRAAIALLAAKVAQVSALFPDMPALPPIEAAASFQQRLQTERQEAARCADADRRIEQATQKLNQAVDDEQIATRTLGGLRAALRTETDEQAEHQLRRCRSVAAARFDSAEALRHLAEQGGGLSIETLSARAAETTPEADAARIAGIDAAHASRLPLIEAARDASTAAAAALDQAGTGMDAAEAAQRREAAQAMLARTAEEALVLHATHALLQTALDRQAAGADQPLLARIGAVFRTITGGVQAGVRIEETKDGQTMVALEADGVTRKSLDQLSEGTCDQLYLALRIAALEDYAKTASPLPFIADDILQTFDDPRTTATLRALLELSERVQVIVLTHHPHVGDLAARIPGDAVRVMRLEG
ncbi:AAA family ATPase [Acidisphaera sp. S103]|uniref:AAA family ATPase n=1 Tax=Acidisphaera sp. S103 TaxID=1747223 RepID=UPI00131DBDEC|nr:AAA family ATPase [Acidisphaera sp. S103]